MFKKTLLGALLALPVIANAESGPHWNSVELDLGRYKPDTALEYLNGFVVSGSFLVNDSVYLKGSMSDHSRTISSVKNERLTYEVQLGYILPANEKTDFYAALGYRWTDPSYNGISDDIDDYTLGLGVRGMLTPQLELKAGVDTFDGDTGYLVGATYKFTPEWGLAAEYKGSDVDKGWMVGVRLDF